jgi:DNA-binding CsgD family transcriptional regulator
VCGTFGLRLRRYLISTKSKTWGALVEVVTDTEHGKAPTRGTRCYTAFEGRTTACETCPVRAAGFERGPTTTVLPSNDDHIRIATARRAPRDTAEVTVRSLGTAEVSVVVREKLTRVAIAAQLSARERTVLDLLLLGERSDEIAEALEISTRTAKFHQANILKKLGVDSRTDLIRLLL